MTDTPTIPALEYLIEAYRDRRIEPNEKLISQVRQIAAKLAGASRAAAGDKSAALRTRAIADSALAAAKEKPRG